MTTASLHRKMVEALRHVLACASRADCGGCEDCHEVVGAALEGWEKREPLGQTPAVLSALAYLVTGKCSVGETADALDALLFGERG